MRHLGTRSAKRSQRYTQSAQGKRKWEAFKGSVGCYYFWWSLNIMADETFRHTGKDLLYPETPNA